MKNARPTEVKPSALDALLSAFIIAANNSTIQQAKDVIKTALGDVK